MHEAVRFELSISTSACGRPITGRLFLIVSTNEKTEPRLQLFDVPAFAADVSQLEPGVPVVIGRDTPGYPINSLLELPAGDYYVQALLNVCTEFHRADGHTIWAHMDQWDGQDMTRSPGNLISEVQRLHLDPNCSCTFKLNLNKIIPPIEIPSDTEWVKRIKIQSELLTGFWGRPIYVGATVLLPRGYDENVALHYPVMYLQGHFSMEAPFGFKTEPDPEGAKSWARRREECAANKINMPEPPADAEFNGVSYNVESGYEFYQTWNSDHFPRMIAVTFQHPTPYFDNSYGINSANAGPYGDCIMTELIPYIEEHFRVIRRPYARLLTGCSTGGWGSLALQAFHPDFFGGAWIFCPDPVDFRRYYGAVNLYEDRNAFAIGNGQQWVLPERCCFRGQNGQARITNRQFTKLTSIMGTQDAGYGWLNYTPAGSDGYPRPVWDLVTGEIDHEVVQYMKENNCDLREYLERNWPKIGSELEGKLHFYCGDEDGGYFNLALYLLEDFLENTREPYYAGTFTYGRPLKGHGWQPMSNAELVVIMAEHVLERAPADEHASRWFD